MLLLQGTFRSADFLPRRRIGGEVAQLGQFSRDILQTVTTQVLE